MVATPLKASAAIKDGMPSIPGVWTVVIVLTGERRAYWGADTGVAASGAESASCEIGGR